MRGKALSRRVDKHNNRITPAYAGKRWAWTADTLSLRDHPRLCGEKVKNAYSYTLQAGSPPPMRGKVQLTMFALCAIRITPAYAGKSSLIQCFFIKTYGSPPPMRGKD